MKSLNVVASANQENINEIIGNMASEGDRVYSDIVIGSTDVIFSRLEVKETLETTLSKQSFNLSSSESQNKNLRCGMADSS